MSAIGHGEIVLTQATPCDIEHLCGSLQSFNEPYTPGDQEAEIRLVARGAHGVLSGGTLADVALGWAEIHVLWVEPGQRCVGLGAALLEACERRAVALSAPSARLDSFDSQAEDFYTRNGSTCFSRLRDYPTGHQRLLMSKPLV